MSNRLPKFGNLNAITMHHDSIMGGGGGGGGEGGKSGDGGGNPTPFDFRSLLPEDIRKDALFDVLKPKDQAEAIALLGKGYAHAQRSLGTARLEAPNEKWTDKEWDKFYAALGRPETPDKYEVPEFKFAEGLAIIPEKLAAYKAHMHKLGFTPKQVKGMMEFYFKDVNEAHVAAQSEEARLRAQAESTLKEKFGDKYEANMDIARAVLKKHGSESFVEFMNSSGLGNHPEFVQFMVKVGTMLHEDHATDGGDRGLPLGKRAQAEMDLAKFKGDPEKMKALNDRYHAGHKAALDEWTALHRAAAG